MNMTVKAHVATLQAAVDIHTAATGPHQSCESITCSPTFQPYPVSLLRQSVAKGGNSQGLHLSDGPLVLVFLPNYWQKKSDNERVLAVMKAALEEIREKAVENDTASDFIYLNYAADFQDPIDCRT
ncbi:hypothetical protein F4781DRAFT_402798 [Annulohypoxylon bovei var. microspora]|nr:hypothetical protein F4781DRAFT_402798 [Annulohypoxylon bovei var. microspora]